MNSGLYAIIHKASGRAYIGQTSNFARRQVEHFKKNSKSCPKLAAAIAYYGRDAFSFTILVQCCVGSYLDELETHAIVALGGLEGFNLNELGVSSPMLNPTTARKSGNTQRRNARKGVHQSQRPEWRSAHSVAMRNAMEKRLANGTHTSTSEAYRNKVSATLKRKALEGKHPCQDPTVRGKIAAKLLGRVWVNLRGHSTTVHLDRLPEYLRRGWRRGRPTGSAGLRLTTK